MTQNRFRFLQASGIALTLVLSATALGSAAAGPYAASEAVAAPGGGNTAFVQLKQISGFTGQLTLSESGGDYQPVGSSFNKLAKFRLSVSCPAGFHPDNAGLRIRGDDVVNFNLQLLAPGALGPGQTSWQQVYDNEPWKFDAVVVAGADALDAAGSNGPVYVSLDEVLDSRTEFYGWCIPDSALSGQTAFYYDSAQEGTDLYPMTRVRYQAQAVVGIAKSRQLKANPETRRAGVADRLRHRDRAAPAAQTKALLKAPGGCPYDCPPPAPRLRFKN